MQRAMFGDMEFRSNGMGEDCLYLNVWTPARSGEERLPVLVYFYGGGYRAGDGSEPRYDGASMAGKGIVAVTVNYRLGVFGFLAHPELSQEAPYHASGNYGLLDQNAALRWVQANIAAFGGDPKRVTIAGESAGSISVSAQVASPLSKDLIAGAIMESGSLIGSMTPRPLSEAEPEGVKFATGAGATSIAALRALTAEQVLELTRQAGLSTFRTRHRRVPAPEGRGGHPGGRRAGPRSPAGRVELRGAARARPAETGRADARELRQGRARRSTATGPRRC